jgi:capsular polysaccharide transport system permease protein
MVAWLPPAARETLLWLPMVHGVEMVRHGYFGDVVTTYENPAYFALVNLCLTLIGLAMIRDTARKVQPA